MWRTPRTRTDGSRGRRLRTRRRVFYAALPERLSSSDAGAAWQENVVLGRAGGSVPFVRDPPPYSVGRSGERLDPRSDRGTRRRRRERSSPRRRSRPPAAAQPLQPTAVPVADARDGKAASASGLGSEPAVTPPPPPTPPPSAGKSSMIHRRGRRRRTEGASRPPTPTARSRRAQRRPKRRPRIPSSSSTIANAPSAANASPRRRCPSASISTPTSLSRPRRPCPRLLRSLARMDAKREAASRLPLPSRRRGFRGLVRPRRPLLLRRLALARGGDERVVHRGTWEG